MITDFYLEEFLTHHLQKRAQKIPTGAKRLIKSVQYSIFNGGKRFRPKVAALTAEALNCGPDRVWAFAAALELVHTYSLIHDDLPCMDNDVERRGQPTNHVVFGEATALLAGDALLTEAFYIISDHYKHVPEIGLSLTRILSEAAGLTGMVAGQTMDVLIELQGRVHSQDEFLSMHKLKTGALIWAAVMGAAEIARASAEQKKNLNEFGWAIGLAFQLADDILDYNPNSLEASGFPKLVGINETKQMLTQCTQQALNALEVFGSQAKGLIELTEYNLNRKK